jgi:hypothetical protein
MVQIAIVSLGAREPLPGRTPGSDAHAPYREAIATLTNTRLIELEPDAGETVDKLKLNVARAAKEAGRQVGSALSRHGTLLIWLEPPKQQRGSRKRAESGAS